MKIVVTGGAGFIGSALVDRLLTNPDNEVVVVDAYTYAAHPNALSEHRDEPRLTVERSDIREFDAMVDLFERVKPDWVAHLAAESHVDRSISGSAAFIETNVMGTHSLLEAARGYWEGLSDGDQSRFRFLHVSTDEVFGSLGEDGAFSETTPYDPSSPYSASKAASDHLVAAWGRTYGLPILISNCSNNYGPRQFPEKLIPLAVLNALHGQPIPVYGDGLNVRDWIHVEDHVAGLEAVLNKGRVGETYNIGAGCERQNIDVVKGICDRLDEVGIRNTSHYELVAYVDDRLGHDRRYAIDSSKVEAELAWKPVRNFEDGLRDTVDWYLANREWWGVLRETD